MFLGTWSISNFCQTCAKKIQKNPISADGNSLVGILEAKKGLLWALIPVALWRQTCTQADYMGPKLHTLWLIMGPRTSPLLSSCVLRPFFVVNANLKSKDHEENSVVWRISLWLKTGSIKVLSFRKWIEEQLMWKTTIKWPRRVKTACKHENVINAFRKKKHILHGKMCLEQQCDDQINTFARIPGIV